MRLTQVPRLHEFDQHRRQCRLGMRAKRATKTHSDRFWETNIFFVEIFWVGKALGEGLRSFASVRVSWQLSISRSTNGLVILATTTEIYCRTERNAGRVRQRKSVCWIPVHYRGWRSTLVLIRASRAVTVIVAAHFCGNPWVQRGVRVLLRSSELEVKLIPGGSAVAAH